MRYLLWAIAFCVAGCGGQAPESRFDKIARAYCECTGPLATMNAEAAALAADTNAVAAFQERLQAIQTAYNEARTCTAAIIAQYGKLKAAELDSVNMALSAGKCAGIVEQGDLLQEMLGE